MNACEGQRWEREWRDRMPSSTRMWRAGASKILNKSPCSSRAAQRSRCGHCASFYIEERFVDSMTSARYLTGRHARDRDCRPGHARGPGQQGRPGRGNAQAVTFKLYWQNLTQPGSRGLPSESAKWGATLPRRNNANYANFTYAFLRNLRNF